MKCPGNEEHRGVKFVLARITSNHYANMLCNECGAWIRNVSFLEMEGISSSDSDEVDEAVQETDVDRMERCLREARVIQSVVFGGEQGAAYRERVIQIAFKLFDGREK